MMKEYEGMTGDELFERALKLEQLPNKLSIISEMMDNFILKYFDTKTKNEDDLKAIEEKLSDYETEAKSLGLDTTYPNRARKFLSEFR